MTIPEGQVQANPALQDELSLLSRSPAVRRHVNQLVPQHAGDGQPRVVGLVAAMAPVTDRRNHKTPSGVATRCATGSGALVPSCVPYGAAPR